MECSKLKECLTTVLSLANDDFTKPFRLYTDASNKGLGVVSSQLLDGDERVIAYARRALRRVDLNDHNYSSFKIELLAMKWAIYPPDSKITCEDPDLLCSRKNYPFMHLDTVNLQATEQFWVACNKF